MKTFHFAVENFSSPIEKILTPKYEVSKESSPRNQSPNPVMKSSETVSDDE